MRLPPQTPAVVDDSVTLWDTLPLPELLAAFDAEIIEYDFGYPAVVGYAVERRDGHIAIVLTTGLSNWMRDHTARDLLARMRRVVLPGQAPLAAA